MTEAGPTPLLRDYAAILTRDGWVLLMATLLSAGAGYGATLAEPAQFSASTQLFAVIPGDAGVRAQFESDRGSTAAMSGYAALATSRIVLDRTIGDLDLNMAPADLARQITTTVTPRSVLLRIDVTSTDRDRVAEISKRITTNVVGLAQQLQNTPNGTGAELLPVDLDPTAQMKSSSPWPGAVSGGIVGLVLSGLFVLTRGLIDDAVAGSRQVSRLMSDTLRRERERSRV